MDTVSGKVAVVTGGSSGIGRGIALAFARAGMTVVVTGRRPAHLEETVAEFAAEGLAVHPLQVDVTDREGMARAAEEVQQRFGRLDVLVNNAGIGLTSSAANATPEDWDWVTDVNIRGVGNGLMAFLPLIRAHGEGGAIVNTASMAGLMPIVAGLYSMTKAGVIALSEALHIELAPENITVSAYCPGPVHSNIASSVADRPAEYGGPTGAGPDPARVEAMRSQPYMSAEEAGERVLAGMLRGDLFLLTHPEFREGVAGRHRAIENAFPAEEINTVRRDAIGLLLDSPVYAAQRSRPSPSLPQ